MIPVPRPTARRHDARGLALSNRQRLGTASTAWPVGELGRRYTPSCQTRSTSILPGLVTLP